jgi:hypothetical protein
MSVFTDDSGGVRPWVTYTAIAAVLLVGGYFVYGAWTKNDRALEARLMCYSCEYTSSKELKVGEVYPQPCPKCEKQTFVPALNCSKCGAPNVWNEDRGAKPPTKCRKCGVELRHG